MLTAILLAILVVVLLGAVGFAPAQSFTPWQRGTVGTLILVGFLLYLFRYSGLLH